MTRLSRNLLAATALGAVLGLAMPVSPVWVDGAVAFRSDEAFARGGHGADDAAGESDDSGMDGGGDDGTPDQGGGNDDDGETDDSGMDGGGDDGTPDQGGGNDDDGGSGRGRGGDDGAGHSAIEAPFDLARRGRGADDGAGDDRGGRRGRGADDGPNHS